MILVIVGSYNSFLYFRHQSIIWTNAGLFTVAQIMARLGSKWNFCNMKMYLKTSFRNGKHLFGTQCLNGTQNCSLQYVVLVRSENFTVFVSDLWWPITAGQLSGSSFTECGQYPGIPPSGETFTVKCNPFGLLGCYVYVHQPTAEWVMNLCEVKSLVVIYYLHYIYIYINLCICVSVSH